MEKLVRHLSASFIVIKSMPRLFHILLFSICLPSCKEPSAPATFHGKAMGTTWQVTLTRPNPELSTGDIAAEVERIESMASAWREDSFLTLFNKSTSTAPQPCPPEIAEMITFSLKLHELTNGAFDITVAPLVKKWGFGPEAGAADTSAIGSSNLEVTVSPPTLKKIVASVQIDLNAIAKGYAVDKVAALLDAAGCTDYLIEIGGELRAAGKIWKVGIEKPDPASVGEIAQIIELQNQSIATSGTYRHFRESQDTSHIIDPRSGAPLSHGCPAVTVTAPTCMEADAWATALLVLGPVDGAALAESRKTITARFAPLLR